MQVHPTKYGYLGEQTRRYRLYMLLAIAVFAAAILTVIVIGPQHLTGNSSMVQICYPKGAHLCFLK